MGHSYSFDSFNYLLSIFLLLSIHYHSSSLFLLLWLLAQVHAGKIVIAGSPSIPVLLEGLLIGSQRSLSELEFLVPIVHLGNVLLSSGLEGLFGFEFLLEVQPVLRGIVKGLLYMK